MPGLPHVKTDEVILHSVVFVVSVTAIGVRTMQLINTKTETASGKETDTGIVRFGGGIFSFPQLPAEATLEKPFLIWGICSG